MTNRTEQQQVHDYDRAQDYYSADQYGLAIPLLRRLADEGYSPAYFKLAQYEFYVGNQIDAQPWLTKLEAAASKGNATANYLCFLAHRGGWTMKGIAYNDPIAERHLLKAAELNHTFAQYTLAQELRTGANGQTKSENGYLHWIQKAIEGGSEDAVYDHIKYLDKKGLPIPADLMADLDVLADDYPNARKLRDKLKRRAPR